MTFFQNLLEKLFRKDPSGEVAKNRLKVVIMQDRTTFTPVMMDSLRTDLISVFKSYFEIEEEGLEFNMDREDESVGLSISIPIKKVRDDILLNEEEEIIRELPVEKSGESTNEK